mmetsp:Transcript_3272/g.10016  ORF Transcript_3272/g.10016 Transcript_3272/m.10016 type:complete len:107 (+) Transcript_3272:734-1054(+)
MRNQQDLQISPPLVSLAIGRHHGILFSQGRKMDMSSQGNHRADRREIRPDDDRKPKHQQESTAPSLSICSRCERVFIVHNFFRTGANSRKIFCVQNSRAVECIYSI